MDGVDLFEENACVSLRLMVSVTMSFRTGPCAREPDFACWISREILCPLRI